MSRLAFAFCVVVFISSCSQQKEVDNKNFFEVKEGISWRDKRIPEFIEQFSAKYPSELPYLLDFYKQNDDTTRMVIWRLHEGSSYDKNVINSSPFIGKVGNTKVLFRSPMNDFLEIDYTTEKNGGELICHYDQWEILMIKDSLQFNQYLTPFHNWMKIEIAQLKKIKY
jgi:hypothetical protein